MTPKGSAPPHSLYIKKMIAYELKNSAIVPLFVLLESAHFCKTLIIIIKISRFLFAKSWYDFTVETMYET